MFLERLARIMYHRRRTVVAVWLGLLVGLTVLAGRWGGDHRADYSIPGSDSAEAAKLLGERLPALSGDLVQLVFTAPDGIDQPALRARVDAAIAEAGAVPHVRGVQPLTVSPSGTIALAMVQLDARIERVPIESIHQLMDIAEQATNRTMRVDAGGAAVQEAEGAEAGSEQIGMGLALVILLIAFGSVLAAGLPIVIAVFGVGVGLAVGKFLNHLFMVPDWAPQLVTMIGIGVGIDYALFVVVRYRSALKSGMRPDDAVAHALGTAGRAVLFAGGTVTISLLGLCAMGMDYLYGTAAVTVCGVFVVVAASMTLLPALLGFAGTSIDRLRLPFVKSGGDDPQGLWARWSRVVQRYPLVTGAVALVALLAMAVPVFGLRLGYPDAGTGPSSLTSRRAYDAVATGFGAGANGPLVVAVDTAGDDTVVPRLESALRTAPGVATVMPPVVDTTTNTAALFVIPASGPQDEATEATLHRLRDDVLPKALGRTTASAHVGGAIAASVDEREHLAPRLPVFIAAVIALSFLLLLVVFRSLLVALKAAAMNVLAIGAAYGVMALALQGGWFGHLFGITEPTPIPVWAPMMMFAMLFGLSMDYEVFLLSRIREEYDRTRDNASAVAHGIANTGRVISAAAAIMVTVFGAFILADGALIKAIGIGLSVAVAIDATLVRMVLVPSTMELLGDRNWWLPRWLDRLLPVVNVEGHTAAGVHDGADDGLDDELRVLLDEEVAKR